MNSSVGESEVGKKSLEEDGNENNSIQSDSSVSSIGTVMNSNRANSKEVRGSTVGESSSDEENDGMNDLPPIEETEQKISENENESGKANRNLKKKRKTKGREKGIEEEKDENRERICYTLKEMMEFGKEPESFRLVKEPFEMKGVGLKGLCGGEESESDSEEEQKFEGYSKLEISGDEADMEEYEDEGEIYDEGEEDEDYEPTKKRVKKEHEEIDKNLIVPRYTIEDTLVKQVKLKLNQLTTRNFGDIREWFVENITKYEWRTALWREGELADLFDLILDSARYAVHRNHIKLFAKLCYDVYLGGIDKAADKKDKRTRKRANSRDAPEFRFSKIVFRRIIIQGLQDEFERYIADGLYAEKFEEREYKYTSETVKDVYEKDPDFDPKETILSKEHDFFNNTLTFVSMLFDLGVQRYYDHQDEEGVMLLSLNIIMEIITKMLNVICGREEKAEKMKKESDDREAKRGAKKGTDDGPSGPYPKDEEERKNHVDSCVTPSTLPELGRERLFDINPKYYVLIGHLCRFIISVAPRLNESIRLRTKANLLIMKDMANEIKRIGTEVTKIKNDNSKRKMSRQTREKHDKLQNRYREIQHQKNVCGRKKNEYQRFLTMKVVKHMKIISGDVGLPKRYRSLILNALFALNRSMFKFRTKQYDKYSTQRRQALFAIFSYVGYL